MRNVINLPLVRLTVSYYSSSIQATHMKSHRGRGQQSTQYIETVTNSHETAIIQEVWEFVVPLVRNLYMEVLNANEQNR